MQTTADLFRAFNVLFLDFAPVVSLAALAAAFFLKRRDYRQEERELKERIGRYRAQAESR